MVCTFDEDAHFNVKDGSTNGYAIKLPVLSTVGNFFTEVGRKFNCDPETFELVLSQNSGNIISLTSKKEETLKEIGCEAFSVSNEVYAVQLYEKSFPGQNAAMSQDEAAGGDVEHGPPRPPPLPPPPPVTTVAEVGSLIGAIHPEIEPVPYVGLVNQAMTCYLNSLLQALFMTPEFRNALYKWDGSDVDDENKSMPRQLQRLFLNLQTSNRSSVETTALTRSFGWDSSEAWQQHDIQELCRVMFDALEVKFKNTAQADLINQLYEGKMTDYVKCLECLTEKCREDKFLDIPLPVRPFGSHVAYSSVEEALRAFVQPETLDGNNQYFCERCNKKCDAHKGLKFTKFPYLLTLHLKRFDFDFSTLHRIKLNDKVTFPEILNLNSFISSQADDSPGIETTEEAIKCDDSSTTDSGSALDEDHYANEASAIPSGMQNNHYFTDDDEGIDVSNVTEMEKNRQNASEESSGPYLYELFAIMIHSGSASGGHYYAYIMDFKQRQWYCFNDQSVTRISRDDIVRTFGGNCSGSSRGYYSGAFSSSTNAYMLMYRQLDAERNAQAMTVDEFPEHIKELKRRMDEQQQIEMRVREREAELRRFKIYFKDSRYNAMHDYRVCVSKDATLRDTLMEAYKTMDLEEVVPFDCCRLVKYDRLKDQIICSFEEKDDEPISEVLPQKCELLMEIRPKDRSFQVHRAGDITTKVFVLDPSADDFEGPVCVRGNLDETVLEYRKRVASLLEIDVNCLQIALEQYYNEARFLVNEDNSLRTEEFFENKRVYVTTGFDQDVEKVQRLIDRVKNIINLSISLPVFTREDLEALDISLVEEMPAVNDNLNKLELKDGLQEQQMPGHDREWDQRDSALPDSGAHSDQSEDSSLTDSERTIVGDVVQSDIFQLSPPFSSDGSVKSFSSPDEVTEEPSSARPHRQRKRKSDSSHLYFFRATPVVTAGPLPANRKMLRVLVDKRMVLKTLKEKLQPFVGVPVDYFKVFRLNSSQSEVECTRLTESLTMYRDEEDIIVKLGRALRADESTGNVYLLSLKNSEFTKFLCEFVIATNAPVVQVKQQLADELRRKHNIDLPSIERIRLRQKQWKNAGQPYLDGTAFEDFTGNTWDLFVQVLDTTEPCTCPLKQRLIFVRQWLPNEFRLQDEFDEILMEGKTVLELKEKISELSKIPMENLEIAKSSSPFPCADLSRLSIVSDLDWNPNVENIEAYPLLILDHGQVIFYRDNREKQKQLTNEEKKEVFSRHNRANNIASTTSYTGRRERGLKIYLDTPSTCSRKEDMDVD